LADQTSNADIPSYVATKAEWSSDAAFVAGIQHALPQGAMVYQYPFVPFPENPPVVNMADYDEMKGWLHSSTLRWSYGAFKGSVVAEWQPRLNQFPLEIVVPTLAMIGFQGVTVDRAGYTDHGLSFEGSLSAIAPGPGLTSGNGLLSFFDLQALEARVRGQVSDADRQAIAQAALDLPAVTAGTGFYPLAGAGPGSSWWSERKGTLDLMSPVDQQLVLRTRLVGPVGTITLQFPDGTQDKAPVSPAGIDYVHPFRVKAGVSSVTLATDGPQIASPGDSRVLFFQLKDPAITGVAFDGFALGA
ncbi:MAG TPA: hypothetical protein VHU17_20030, partial [Acidimicrobiales bacterium]|nr:hypothetical protein [Acidimicrobiales bacterium]